MLACVAAIAILLFVGSTIRTHTDTDPTRGVGGLRILADGDELLAFQDFGFGAEGWQPEVATSRIAGLGPVMGPITNEAVTRVFALPQGVPSVHLAMDLHLLGNWTGRLRLSIDGVEILALTRPGPDQAASDTVVTEGAGHVAVIRATEVALPAAATDLPGAAGRYTSYSLRMNVVPRGTSLELRLQAEGGPASPGTEAVAGSGAGTVADGGDGVAPVWALDNLTVIALAGAPDLAG